MKELDHPVATQLITGAFVSRGLVVPLDATALVIRGPCGVV
jgi:hypothetical protein